MSWDKKFNPMKLTRPPSSHVASQPQPYDAQSYFDCFWDPRIDYSRVLVVGPLKPAHWGELETNHYHVGSCGVYYLGETMGANADTRWVVPPHWGLWCNAALLYIDLVVVMGSMYSQALCLAAASCEIRLDPVGRSAYVLWRHTPRAPD